MTPCGRMNESWVVNDFWEDTLDHIDVYVCVNGVGAQKEELGRNDVRVL